MTHLSIDLQHALSFAGNPPQLVSITGKALKFQMSVLSVDSLACALDEMKFVPNGVEWPSAMIRRFAERTCQRVIYLMEPLSILEFDSQASALQARSTNPTTTDEVRCYFELTLSGSSGVLRRYSVRPGQPRQQTTMTLTREVLARLTSDLDQIASELS